MSSIRLWKDREYAFIRVYEGIGNMLLFKCSVLGNTFLSESMKG